MSGAETHFEQSPLNTIDASPSLGTLCEAIPQGVLVIRSNGEIVCANSRVRRFLDGGNGQCAERLSAALVQMAQAAMQSQSVENRSLPLTLFPAGLELEGPELNFKVIPLLVNHERLAVMLIENLREPQDGNGNSKSFYGLVGRHPSMVAVYDMLREVGPLDVPVLIQGESGTGKELVARALHQISPRSGGNLVTMNCTALAEGVLESEFFGHVRGAFSGAIRDRKGRFELARKGTLFLDEIGDLSPNVQAKLLRVLQDGSFERVGDSRTLWSDARIICATNRHLEGEIAAGRYRADLYYRFSVVVIQLPSLPQRRSDIPLLAEYLVAKAAEDYGREVPSIQPEVMKVLQNYRWPGNVRQLENVMRHALIRSGGRSIEMGHLPASLVRGGAPSGHVTRRRRTRLTSRVVLEALKEAEGVRSRAAQLLGVSRATLYRFLSQHAVSERGDTHAIRS